MAFFLGFSSMADQVERSGMQKREKKRGRLLKDSNLRVLPLQRVFLMNFFFFESYFDRNLISFVIWCKKIQKVDEIDAIRSFCNLMGFEPATYTIGKLLLLTKFFFSLNQPGKKSFISIYATCIHTATYYYKHQHALWIKEAFQFVFF